MTPENLERVTTIFRTIFNDDALELRDDLTAGDVPAWDSLNHVNLFMALEQEFTLRFTNAEISNLQNVGELFALIDRKLGV